MTDDAGQDRVPDVNFPARISTVPLRELQNEPTTLFNRCTCVCLKATPLCVSEELFAHGARCLEPQSTHKCSAHHPLRSDPTTCNFARAHHANCPNNPQQRPLS